MAENEKIINQFTDIRAHKKETPTSWSLKNGTMVLTNKRIMFLRSRLGGTTYNDFQKIEKDLQKKDSFSINIDNIEEVDTDFHFSAPYLKIRVNENGETNFATFWSSEVVSSDYMIDIALTIQRELKKKDSEYQEISKLRTRNLVQIDQTHDQQTLFGQSLRVAIKAAAVNSGSPDPIILTDLKKQWENDENLQLNRTALLASFGTKDKKYKPQDIEKIQKYIYQGGVFFLTPEPKQNPPNELVQKMGVKYEEFVIKDKDNHENGYDDHIIVNNFVNHPINKDIKSISFGDYGCYPIILTAEKGTPLAYSSLTSDPANSIVAALIPYGNGKVITVGQNKIFEDNFLSKHDNLRWAQNIFEYSLLMEKKATLMPDTTIRQVRNFCTNCGAKLEPEDKFCGECGTIV